MTNNINTVAVDFHHMRKDGMLNASTRNLSDYTVVGDQVLAQDKLNGGWAICRVAELYSISKDEPYGRGSLILEIIEFYDGEL